MNPIFIFLGLLLLAVWMGANSRRASPRDLGLLLAIDALWSAIFGCAALVQLLSLTIKSAGVMPVGDLFIFKVGPADLASGTITAYSPALLLLGLIPLLCGRWLAAYAERKLDPTKGAARGH